MRQSSAPLGAHVTSDDDVVALLMGQHASAEERREFAFLWAVSDPDQRRKVASAVKAEETVAPTRPHPGVESAAKKIAVGPVDSLVDRTRDAIRKAIR